MKEAWPDAIVNELSAVGLMQAIASKDSKNLIVGHSATHNQYMQTDD